MAPKVSIIIPAYNAENTIKKCVESIQRQTYKEIEILIVDDGSEDHTLQFCRAIENEDTRCHVIHKGNGGVSSARNIGIQVATGNYVMFADSDDTMQPDNVEQYINMVMVENVDMVVGGINWHDKDKCKKYGCPCEGKYGIEIWENICKHPEMFGHPVNKIYKTNIIRKFKIFFNEQMYSQEDLAFNLSYFAKCESFYVTNYAGYNYFYQPGKRMPPVWDFISNSLNMRNIALSKTELSDQAERAIQQRVLNNIFCYLYERKSWQDYILAYDKVRLVENLIAYLSETRTTGEYKVLVRYIVRDNPRKLFYYFKIRDTAKQFLKRNH
ncbi:MAG: glycosyltransferase family 2 protein [Lachnospiraceae bacterium]|nr:glycosyltransferase family 2 protein [Lachnospiraceae bacterium]